MKRSACFWVALLLTVSCAKQTKEIKPEDLDTFAQNTALASRDFVYTREAGGSALVVSGFVQDDYRYEAQVLLDGELVYEEKIVDDTRYLRVAAPQLIEAIQQIRTLDRLSPTTAPQTGTISGLDLATEDLLATGQWVMDPTGAPPEFASTEGPMGALDAQEILQRVRFIEILPTVLHQGGTLAAWNPDDANYLPANDKFPPIDTKRFEDRFVERFAEDGTRFDLSPEAFDPSLVPSGLKDIERFFLHTSVWTKDRRITRVARVFELPDPNDPTYRDFFEPLETGTIGEAAKTFLGLLKNLENRRLYAETFIFRRPDPSRQVDPPDDAAPGILKPPAPVESRGSEEVPGQVEPAPETSPIPSS